MSRAAETMIHAVKSNTLTGQFVVSDSFVHPKKCLIKSVTVVGHNPADADGDTVALDISYSTDAFSSSDVEVAAIVAVEYNDTDNTAAIVAETPKDIALTPAAVSTVGGDSVVELPAGANLKTTITWTGSPADGSIDVLIEYIPVGP